MRTPRSSSLDVSWSPSARLHSLSLPALCHKLSSESFMGETSPAVQWLILSSQCRRPIFDPCLKGFPGGSDSKESACQYRRPRFDSWVGKIPWRREWLPTPVYLPGEYCGQKSLAGYSPGSGRVGHATVQEVAKSQTQLSKKHYLILQFSGR